jgi:hypothetical protein
LKGHEKDVENSNEIENRLTAKRILTKFVKNNIKLTVPLELNQIGDLIKLFVDKSIQ